MFFPTIYQTYAASLLHSTDLTDMRDALLHDEVKTQGDKDIDIAPFGMDRGPITDTDGRLPI